MQVSKNKKGKMPTNEVIFKIFLNSKVSFHRGFTSLFPPLTASLPGHHGKIQIFLWDNFLGHVISVSQTISGLCGTIWSLSSRVIVSIHTSMPPIVLQSGWDRLHLNL